MKCYDSCCQPDDYDTAETLARRLVSATRKPHPCWYCGWVIPVGSPARVEAVLYDGKVSSHYRHISPSCMYP